MAEKHYVGNGREKIFDNGGSVINIFIKTDELKKCQQHKGGFRLVVGKRREEDQYGNTHYVAEDTYQKKESDDPF